MSAGAGELLVTGRIASLAGRDGPAWVEAVAVRDGRVVAAGSEAAAAAALGAGAHRLALGSDEVAIPGLTDSHLHLAEAALAARRIDLSDAGTLAAGLERIETAAREERNPAWWLLGGGWDADRWGGWPTSASLDAIAAGRRVAVWAHDHHALWVSGQAMAAAGIGADSPDPPGGLIRRDDAGRPTGILHEAAARLVMALVPPPGPRTIEAAVMALVPRLRRLGVVAVHDPGALSVKAGLGEAIAAYRSLAAAARLGLRVHACIRAEQLDAAIGEGLRSGEPLGPDPAHHLWLGWLKLFADGTLGSRTAALLDPLDTVTGEPPPPNYGRGVWLTEPPILAGLARDAARAGIATQVHAIGDAAVRAALEALAPTARLGRLMPRIEHAQLVARSDVARFAGLGVAASVQPIHVRSDAEKARRLWGPRADERGYPYGSLARTGAVVCLGTDAPVEPFDPWPGLACAVTRAAPSWPAGTAPFGPHESLPLWRAVRAACVDPAISAGERNRGRLLPGYRADLVILDAGVVDEPVGVDGALWHARPRRVLFDGVDVTAE